MELTPQGTLAEKLRCGGSGIPEFYAITGAGTQVADGSMPWRCHPAGIIASTSPAKPNKEFIVHGETRTYVQEESIVPDFALVRPRKAAGSPWPKSRSSSTQQISIRTKATSPISM